MGQAQIKNDDPNLGLEVLLDIAYNLSQWLEVLFVRGQHDYLGLI